MSSTDTCRGGKRPFAGFSREAASAPAAAFKFQFGAEKAAPGYTLVAPTLVYSK